MKRGTSSEATKAASRVLDNPSAGRAAKTAAGSALTQSKAPRETTSPTAASRVLRDGRSSKASKTAAASALAQTKRKS